jgi:mycofactocin system FadH/OYE family oxidoreductase 2
MNENLFSPLTSGRFDVPNRICLLAHRTNFSKNALLNDRHIAYYRRRAQGGCGLIILGELTVHPDDRPWESIIQAARPEAMEGLRRLTSAVHGFDTRIFAQLSHHGFQSSGAISRKVTWGPSAISDIVFGETCKPMEPEDMAELLEAFVLAADQVKQAGFDGLEIDMGPESLLRQFLSPISNHREDEYGGNLENRMRFPVQVMTAVRNAVGPEFTVGVCLCADEKFWGGISPDDSVQVAQALESASLADYFNVSVGTYYNLHLIMPPMHIPEGFTVEAAEWIKKSVSGPVITSYQIGFPAMAETLISEGRTDLVGFVRALICDPDMPLKARDGRLEDIRYCVKDNKGCIGRVNQSKKLGCIQNPQVGHESLTGDEHWPIAACCKKVIVIGAGPSGMEAARVATERGHDVTVFEAKDKIGGQVNLIGMRPGRGIMQGVTRYLKHCLDQRRVMVRTGVNATLEFILAQTPDAVVVATGSRPKSRPFPGDYGPPQVLSGWDVILETYPVGDRVLFVDEEGGHHAMSTAELLARQGKKVDMITSDLFIGIRLAHRGELYLGRQRLLQLGVTFTTDVEVLEIQGAVVTARDIYTDRRIRYDQYDTVVLDAGNDAQDDLYHQLKGRVGEVYRAGDCVAPRGIDMAILEGRNVGSRL